MKKSKKGIDKLKRVCYNKEKKIKKRSEKMRSPPKKSS